MSAVVNEICDLLQAHANRDKVVSLASYILKLWGASAQRKDLLAASARLGAARATMRLFDDAVALKTLLAYGLGRQDGPLWGSLGVASSVFNLAYLQAEKVVWLMDTGVLVVSKEFDYNARTAHKLFWSLSAFVGLVRSIRALHASALSLQSAQRTKCAGARYRQACFVTSKAFLDVIHSVSWLPQGWLWGGRLSAEKASSVAIGSAVLALVIHYHGKRLASVKK
ncbi:peroxisomal membrane protein 11C-like [Amyelois transitella]|uniref:peroxisomal membrane protein 11C-like n=1 Tax=Amyelois transitella TaxID=680683 RepID=UPI00067BBDA1|nr:peroxisomal membrane protein 11C-like [Amyelois transitella]